MQTIEQFEAETAKKRARLEKDIALVKALPVGHVNDVPILPWLIYDPFRSAEHVAYKAPDSYDDKRYPSRYDANRADFERNYLTALLDMYEPYMLDTLALKGRYSSHVAETWDWQASKDYSDAHIVAGGRYAISVQTGFGECSYTSGELEFFTAIESIGTVKISYKLPHVPRTLIPIPHGIVQDAAHRIHRVGSWTQQSIESVNAVNAFVHGLGDRKNLSSKVLWLFESRFYLDPLLGSPT